ncbi:hypothetical protein GE21DRAFT_6559 [Neurospora crassa]|uniref:Uncharacterized protein n=1 Tax=Neurospora crassa (strain ATCC 24698 / 74-OR23-1A / CBS 708.71 / DSM 1257 / FGSC 987) TaxID=367110 RepID=Q7S8Y6_NEUCR|nr:hypothetical protein NCU08829 [Neurospora crassa OR74A]EAA32804.1 hypothetical protein NCU08829 [Neurospora crassa OR74A]KHE79783.1 hypothetical protein GE21DRAFT_6559 [Neurospora crassa]|eukprot:XP_962040.1 hypothetical protein NCU08829 [Neurospora crassa OR74A]
MPSRTRKKEKQRAKQIPKQEGMKHLQQQESTPTAPTPFSPSSPAAHPFDPTQLHRRQVHTTLLQIKNLYTGVNSTDTTQALLSFLNSLARFPDTLPCSHGGEHSSSYRHTWPHNPLEDMREEGEEISYWIHYLDLIKQWKLRRREAQSWMKYYDAILGRMMEMQRGEAVVDGRVQSGKEDRKRELEERCLGKRKEESAGDDCLGPEIEQGVIDMALADPDDADDDQFECCQPMINQFLGLNGEAQQLTKECTKGSTGSRPNNEAQEPEEKPDVRLSLDICRHLFKQLVPPDLDEEEHEMATEPCRLAFNQIIVTNADARQLTKDCIDGIGGLLDELQSEAEALRVGWTKQDAVEDGVGEDEDEDHHATSYNWMKDLMSADKTEGEDGEIPAGLSEFWRYSKAYFHLYLVISRISSLQG